jgi:hypothetical protein
VTNVLKIRYALGSGEMGQVDVTGDDKWTFGRADGAEAPSLATDDVRVSRNALTIRDSGPGPVVFRGQRGGARVVIVGPDGPVRELDEGTATNLTADDRRVEMWIGEELIVRAEVEFEERGTVRERQDAVED